MTTATEIRLASRPEGVPTHDNFEIVDTEVPTAGDGQILVRNLVMSVDPAMRGRMKDVKSYAPPFQVGEVMSGGAVGEVVESNVDDVKVGDHVLHQAGWRTHAVLDAGRYVKVDGAAAPLSTYLGVLGMPGLTAYAGLLESAEFKPGDTVFVSGAAGAVGSLVGQLAKLKGAKRVIGSAGSAEKVRHLIDDLGFDAAFNYKDGPVAEQLHQAAPEGIDVYFDNVGGEHLEAAIDAITLHGRIAICGMISTYNATEPTPAPRNLAQVIAKRLTIRGLLVIDHWHLQQQFVTEVAPLVSSGEIKYSETFVDGIRNAPEAFLGLLSGANTGKMLVRIAG
ncbi:MULTISPECIES: NADP-dependent oxidoreductase [unclassified Amycolatopsis]|uniref:NADP-dependent oxidoreductase n=1 Tax=unclassified Amycolatopsis TaxID=2618356 RepID=UPI0028740C54|nr:MULTISPECIES: NADP-dependent oxidoreductase [unclassified Amycolatopsis]MDS0132635.1 NADP-dependent oxidoreductase [Amycolatopsis sp. 505]MDS0142540.1 NADP-dependent oxidoreductase [Amycolatopsis sp. CM201R]